MGKKNPNTLYFIVRIGCEKYITLYYIRLPTDKVGRRTAVNSAVNQEERVKDADWILKVRST